MINILYCIGAESEIYNSMSTSTPVSSMSNMEENILPPTPLAPRGEERGRKRPDSAKGKRGRRKDRSNLSVDAVNE